MIDTSNRLPRKFNHHPGPKEPPSAKERVLHALESKLLVLQSQLNSIELAEFDEAMSRMRGEETTALTDASVGFLSGLVDELLNHTPHDQQDNVRKTLCRYSCRVSSTSSSSTADANAQPPVLLLLQSLAGVLDRPKR